MSKTYVASSWRNKDQPSIVSLLRERGHEVYDFRNPTPGDQGFSWRAIDPDWQNWTLERYTELITTHPAARYGFNCDKAALDWCDTCVLLLPCGRSAHLEAGYCCGQGKRTIICLHPDKFEPELMYMLGSAFARDTVELLANRVTERNPLPPHLLHLAQMTAPYEGLVDAAIDLIWSEPGITAKATDSPDHEWLYEPWPEADALICALDAEGE